MVGSLAVTLLLASVTAQGQSTGEGRMITSSRTTTSTSTSTTTSAAATHTIAVGASGHKFTPGETQAKVGDTIEFKFYPVEHWVIRGDFNYPCIPYEYVGTDRRGFSSGPQPVQAITDDGPKFRVLVNDTEPIYFYCGAPGSCVQYHMMGVVNPSKNGTLENWQAKAKDVDYQLRPGEPWPSEAEHPKDLPTATPVPSPNGETGSRDEDTSQGLGPGAIAGIAVGSVLGVLLIAAVALFCLRRRGFSITRGKDTHTPASQATMYTPAPTIPGHPSIVDPGAAQQKTPSYHVHPQAGSHSQFASPTTSPFSAGTYGSYYPPPPPSVSPQPLTGDETISSNASTPYHDHLQAYLQSHQPSQYRTEGKSPVELPTSPAQADTPLPGYQDNRFSWIGAEAEYRPSKEPRHD